MRNLKNINFTLPILYHQSMPYIRKLYRPVIHIAADSHVYT